MKAKLQEVETVEREWIEKIKKGDREAFSRIYDEFAEYALRVAFYLTKDKEIAADAVQETFIRVFKSIHQFDPARAFKPWMYRILLNECNRMLAKKQHSVSIEVVESSLSSVNATNPFEYEEIYQAIDSLDEINRVPVVLKYLHDFSEKDIAETLDTNVNTVKSRLFKGRQKLKSILSSMQKGGDSYDSK